MRDPELMQHGDLPPRIGQHSGHVSCLGKLGETRGALDQVADEDRRTREAGAAENMRYTKAGALGFLPDRPDATYK